MMNIGIPLACALLFVIFALFVRNRAGSCGSCDPDSRCPGCPNESHDHPEDLNHVR